MLLRIILMLTVILSFQYIGHGQNFKEKFGLGIQTEFSIRPSSEYFLFGTGPYFNKSITKQFYEVGIVATWELSNRFNFIFGTEYRRLSRSDYAEGYTRESSLDREIEEIHYWDYHSKGHAIAFTFGLNYELFKFSKFDLTLHAAYGKNVFFKYSIDQQYVISDLDPFDMDGRFQLVEEEDKRTPNYSNTTNSISLETGTGIKFNKFSYEILITYRSAKFTSIDFYYGCRVRYMFL